MQDQATRPEEDTTIIEVVVPAELLPLFHREARDTLAMAAGSLEEGLRWDLEAEERAARRTGAPRKPDTPAERAERIDYEREKVRTADVLLAQVDARVQDGSELPISAERRHIYNTVRGCILTLGSTTMHGVTEDGDLAEIRATMAQVEGFFGLQESIVPADAEPKAT